MAFPNSNLPTAAQPWGREVQKRIENTEAIVSKNETNNVVRDAQLQNSYDRLDKAVNDISTTLGIATAAQDGVTAIEDNIYYPTTTKIDGSTIQSGTINASAINAGVLTGFTIKTAASGTRTELSGTNIRFYDPNGNQSGEIVSSTNNETVIQNLNPGNGLWGTGSYSKSTFKPGSIYFDLKSGNFVGNSTIDVLGIRTSAGFEGSSAVISGTIQGQTITSTGSVNGNSASITNACTAGSFSTSGTVSGGTVSASNFSGTVNTSIANNTTASFSGNVFINTSGNMFRSTAASSRDIKENIRSLDFDTDKYIQISPVIFDYKDGIVSDDSGNDVIGFIAEDFVDAGINGVIIPEGIEGDYIGLRYDKLYMYLHKVVQEQQSTIKSLTARIEALEAKVQ